MENETWGVEHTEDDQTLIVPHTFPADGIIATVNRAWPQYEQFATLIAAAPEMLDVLRQVESAWRHFKRSNLVAELPGIYGTIKSAIAKAEGN